MEADRNLLVATSKRTVKLMRPLKRINLCLPAFGNSMVLLGYEERGQDKVTLLLHVSERGTFLLERPYQSGIIDVGLLNDHQIVVLNTFYNQIEILDLKTHEILQINHQFEEFWEKSLSIQVFSESRTFCIKESRAYKNKKFRLTYYAIDKLGNGIQPLVDWTAGESEWNSQYHTQRINNHSMIGWWNDKYKLEVLFNFFDLKTDPKGKLTKIKISYGSNIELSIINLWQMKPDKYMVMAASTKGHQRKYYQNGQINDNYILETYEGPDKPTLRETKFFPKRDLEQREEFTVCFGLNSYSVFHTCRSSISGTSIESPIFYVDNQTEEVVFTEIWKQPKNWPNYFFPCWKDSSFTRPEYDDKKFEEVTLEIKEIMDLSNQYLQFLLHLNEDFDDDLLQDAMSLLIDL